MRYDLIVKTAFLTLVLATPFGRTHAQIFGGPANGAAGGSASLKTVGDLFNGLPADLRPPKEGWNLDTLPKVEAWVKQNLVGKRVEATVTITNIEVESTRKIEPEQAWHVTASAKAYLKSGAVNGVRFEAPVTEDGKRDVRVDFITDEATARLWVIKREKIRDEFIRTHRPPSAADGTVTGTFKTFEIRRETLSDGGKSTEGYRIKIGLDGFELALKDLPTKTPPKPPEKKPTEKS